MAVNGATDGAFKVMNVSAPFGTGDKLQARVKHNSKQDVMMKRTAVALQFNPPLFKL